MQPVKKNDEIIGVSIFARDITKTHLLQEELRRFEQNSVTVSLGLTMHSADGISIDPLLKRADDALYKAKNAGRNKVICD
ncbi:MAG: diguanylate cyclase [Deltaproteobacteria bacterium]|nr:diguanylate cyclase [Deltaproteobacteria bacterium]